MRKAVTLSLIISVISIVISVVRCEPIYTDWIGVLVGILSLLVTILMGWNIYQVIDLNKIRSKYNGELNYIHNKADFNNGMSYLINSQNLACQISHGKNELIKFQMIQLCLAGVKVLSNFKCFTECNNSIDTTISAIEATAHIKLNYDEIVSLLTMASEIRIVMKLQI